MVQIKVKEVLQQLVRMGVIFLLLLGRIALRPLMWSIVLDLKPLTEGF